MHLAPLIRDAKALSDLVTELKRHPVIGVDTEFIRETTFFPKIALIQVATSKQSWLVDPLAIDPADLQPLVDVFTDARVLKVMHAAFADQEVLYWSFGKIASPVLDTAIGAALLGYGDNIGLAKLTRDVLKIQLSKGRARVKWLTRPLPRELWLYAQQDVDHLVSLAQVISDTLQGKQRYEWALEESRVDPVDFDTPSEQIAHRLAKSGQLDEDTYLCLQELVAWRENRARTANLPRAWVAENDVLMALARARPKSVGELKAFRGLSPKEVDRYGQVIIDAIRRGLSRPRGQVQLPSPRSGSVDVDSLALDLMKAYLSYLAARHEVAPRFLVRTGRAAELLIMANEPLDAWVNRGLLSASAAAVVGPDLKAWVQGKLLLGLHRGKVDVVPRE